LQRLINYYNNATATAWFLAPAERHWLLGWLVTRLLALYILVTWSVGFLFVLFLLLLFCFCLVGWFFMFRFCYCCFVFVCLFICFWWLYIDLVARLTTVFIEWIGFSQRALLFLQKEQDLPREPYYFYRMNRTYPESITIFTVWIKI